MADTEDKHVDDDKVDYEVEDDEIDIVDDTPEADRGRTPAGEPPAEVTDEELAQYSKGRAADRIRQLGKGIHDERRAKEAAGRERDEAVRVAQSIVAENQRLQGSLATNQNALLEQAKRSVASEIEDAKREYRAAHEAFDTEAIIAAQEKLHAAQIKADRVANFRPTVAQPQQNVVQPAHQVQQQPVLDSKTREWQEQNSWFGANRKMTAYALSLHEDLVESGVPVAGEEYYKRINTEMQERFPESFSGNRADASNPQRSKTNVVAPATRSTAPKKIVLTQTQVNLAKRLGVPLELYARKVAEEMRKS